MGEEKKMMVAAFIDFLKMEIKSGQLGEEAAEGLEGMESYPKNYFILVRIKSCNRCVVYNVAWSTCHNYSYSSFVKIKLESKIIAWLKQLYKSTL